MNKNEWKTGEPIEIGWYWVKCDKRDLFPAYWDGKGWNNQDTWFDDLGEINRWAGPISEPAE